MTDLDKLQALTDAATPGPWSLFSTSRSSTGVGLEASEDQMIFWDAGYGITVADPADAEFIAAARTEVPKLIAEVRNLRDTVEMDAQAIGADKAELRAAWTYVGLLEQVIRLRSGEGDTFRDAVISVRDMHRREVIAVHESHGEEAWCPICREHYPCTLVQALTDQIQKEEDL